MYMKNMSSYFKEGEVKVSLHQGDFQIANDDLTAIVVFLQVIVVLCRAFCKTKTILGSWASWQREREKKSIHTILACTIK